ncbi:YceH family protein [Acidicapsa dinghuensis]|uniref:YceH family protein n=1 Tax=Acidicapsa dinghuensis TaxID=2218256 RepID=A0ABW1EL40_9BACT|nr:YceH family protein [Acidicapsa dinghuensis]
MQLTPVEARVLGALIEKEITTPEYYPLSLNALVNACNQKNNREPVMSLDEDQVRQALHGLEDERLAGTVRGDSRVTKYEHRMQEVFNFTRGEIAVVCTLLLRGPQTPGELRGRTERMYRFDELTDVLNVLNKLSAREPALVKVLPRQPGTKEARYVHLFSGDIEAFQPPVAHESYAADSSDANDAVRAEDPELQQRVSDLEADVATLRRELHAMQQEVQRLGKLFD